jgi:hypothetical protein
MSESPTEGGQAAPASSNEPTGQQQQVQTPTAESQSQETISREQSQEAVATPPQNQNENNGGQATDDSLAKFAKSQGIEDVSKLDDTSARLLKIAHDNQKFARNANQPQTKIEDAANELGKPADDASEVEKLNRRVQAFEYKHKTDSFWSQEGKDRNLENTMVEVLNEKKEQFGKDYAFALSQDLDTLYAMAQLKGGSSASSGSDAAREEGRREERETINKSLSAGAPNAHANTGKPTTPPKVTVDWIRNEYDSRNPEHRKLVDEFYQNRK